MLAINFTVTYKVSDTGGFIKVSLGQASNTSFILLSDPCPNMGLQSWKSGVLLAGTGTVVKLLI